MAAGAALRAGARSGTPGVPQQYAVELDARLQDRTDPRARDLVRHAEQLGTRLIPTDGERLDRMVGTRRHQGVVARIDGRRKELKLADVLDGLTEPALFLVLDGIQDPHNLGACLRVADAAGAHAVIAPKDKAVGLNATAVKASPAAIPKCTKPKSAGIEKMPRTAGNKVAAYNVLQKATA